MPKPKQVLIVDDDTTLVYALTARFESLGLEVRTSYDGMAAVYELTIAHEDPPHLIIMDVGLPMENGLRICEMLSDDTLLMPVPVIVLTGRTDETTIRQCRLLGAHYLAKGDDVWGRLRPLACELLELPDAETSQTAAPSQADPTMDPMGSGDVPGPTILCVDDDVEFCRAMEMRLRHRGFEVQTAYNGVIGFWRALKERPAAILLDVQMPGENGEYVLREIRRHQLTRHIPVFIITAHTGAAQERRMRQLGASAYFTKPLDTKALFAEIDRHVKAPQTSI
ncbi:MAG: response regulator [Pirellulales bacterium]|nr:response regulator [Pirellulales bacterium]